MKCLFVIATIIHLAIFSQTVQSQEDKPKTHEVKPGFFEVVETITATVESKNMTPLSADTKNWTDLVIDKIVPEGTRVSKDQPIVWFDTEKIDRKITESEQALALTKLSVESAKLEFDQLAKTFELDRQLAERKHRNTEQDFNYFNDVDKPNRIRSAERGLKNAQWSLEYSQEELNQLERMYQEDELTEESEEIVLKRTRRQVENSQFYLEQAQMRTARTLEYDLPREAEKKQEELERAKLEFEKSKVTLPIEREKKQVAFDKARFELGKQQIDHDKLTADRKRMVINAPSDGVLYFGRCARGKWLSAAGSGSRDLEKGKTVPQNKTIVTIVDVDQLMLRAELTEKQLSHIEKDKSGLATPAAFPNRHVDASVTSISYVPIAADKYDCQLSISETPKGLMPGMTCSIRFVIHQSHEAIAVPESSVFSDNGVDHYVYLTGDDAPEKRSVNVGLTANKKSEITSGLSKGDKILLGRPE